MIKRKQKAHGYQDFWLDLQNPDFIKLAESFGIKGYRLESPSNFQSLLATVMQEKWVKLIEVPFCYPEKVR
jgi:acetolactate synthase-1/2/3 large subunit